MAQRHLDVYQCAVMQTYDSPLLRFKLRNVYYFPDKEFFSSHFFEGTETFKLTKVSEITV